MCFDIFIIFLFFPAIWVTWLIIVISKDQDGFSQACSSAQGCCFEADV